MPILCTIQQQCVRETTTQLRAQEQQRRTHDHDQDEWGSSVDGSRALIFFLILLVVTPEIYAGPRYPDDEYADYINTTCTAVTTNGHPVSHANMTMG